MTKKRLIFTILFFLLFELLVWLGGRFLFSGSEYFVLGIVLTGLALTVIIVYFIVMRSAPKPAVARVEQQIENAPAPAAGPAAYAGGSQEVELMQGLLDEANARLANSPALARERVRPKVSNFPLYLLVGPEGAGKTSNFLNSGLDPELLAGQAYRGSDVAPTQLANIWFAGGSIFVEAGGALFKRDAHSWLRWLGFLKQKGFSSFLQKLGIGKGSGQDFRGVMLCCEVSPFLGDAERDKLAALGRTIQERLRLVGEALGQDYPVYVVFTKSDAIPYFSYYFARFTEAEDQQILGSSLPLQASTGRDQREVYAEAETRRLNAAFNRLYYSLADKRIELLTREGVNTNRQYIYEHPRELRRIRGQMVQFLVDIFRPNPLQPGPMLRGFYFSGTRQVVEQVGKQKFELRSKAPVRQRDDLEATMILSPRNLPKTAPPPEPAPMREEQERLVTRWAFLSELFSKVILADRASSGGYSQRRIDLYQRILLGVAGFFCLLFFFLVFRSWFGNLAVLREAREAINVNLSSYPYSRELPSLESLQTLERLREQVDLLAKYDEDGAPWRLRWGLYSGGSILPQARDLYFRRFDELFMSNIVRNLTYGLDNLPPTPTPTSPYGAVYDSLKSYLMITSGSCKPDKPFLLPILESAWKAGGEIDSARADLARRQIEFYAEQLNHKNPYTLPEQAGTRDRARLYLSQIGGAERLYRGILEEANKTLQRPARLADLAPNYAQVLTGNVEMPASFTLQGWALVQQQIHNGDRKSLGDPCVLGTQQSAVGQILQSSTVDRDLQNLYIKDYIRVWSEFINGISVTGYKDTGDASRKLAILSDNRSPLLALLFMVADNTNLAGAGAAAPQTTESKAQGWLEKLVPSASKVEEAAKQAAGTQEEEVPLSTPADIVKAFQPIHSVVSPANRDRWVADTNSAYINSLIELQQAMFNLSQSSSPSTNSEANQAARKAADNAEMAIRQMSQKFNLTGAQVDAVLLRLLEAPVKEALRFVVTNPSQPLNSGLAGICARLRNLQRKYPFDPRSEQDVSEAEFAGLFAPDSGELWRYYSQQLSRLIVKRGKDWAQSPEVQEPRLTPQFLQFFNRMAAITEAFYPDGKSPANLRYSLKPVVDKNIQSITLDINGTPFTQKGGSSLPIDLAWSPSQPTQRVLLTVKAGATIPFASYDGLWAIFKMMGDADPRQPGSKVVELSKVRRGRGLPEPVLDAHDKPIVVRIELDFPSGIDVFQRNFFTDLQCPGRAAQ